MSFTVEKKRLSVLNCNSCKIDPSCNLDPSCSFILMQFLPVPKY